jgi:hypothetical protein
LATEVSTESTPDAYQDPDTYRPCLHPAYTNAVESSSQVAVRSSSTREGKVRIFAPAFAMLVGVRVHSELCIQSELCCIRRATIAAMYFTSSSCRPGGGFN